MNDPFGQRDDGFGERKVPTPFDMPVAAETAKPSGTSTTVLSIVFGAAVVGGVFFLIAQQDPTRRKEATAVIPSASSTTRSTAPRRGAIAHSVSRQKLVVVTDFATDAEAEAAAREACGVADCVLVETFVASCVARAVGKNDRQEVAYGQSTREAAEKAALTKCGKGCSVQSSSCPEAR